MEFNIHKYGDHCNDPTDKAVVIMDTVFRSKHELYKRQTNGLYKAKPFYVKLGYPSLKYFRWIFQSKKS